MPNLTEDENNDFENSMARDALEKVKTFQNSHDLKVNFFSLLRALEVGCQGVSMKRKATMEVGRKRR